MTTISDSRATPALFTRKATGLVRQARTVDALFYNVMWASVALAFAFYWLFYGFYQGSNAWVAFLIAACLGLPGAFLYAMLAQIMPRTGGDYVFNSRSLHPSIGFAGNFSYCVWLAVIYGVYTTYLAAYGFGAFGRMMAGFTGSAAWLDFGDWFSKDYALFITGTVMLLLSAAVFMVGGLRLFLRLQVGAFVLYVLGAFLLPVLVGIFQSKTGFVANFNDYAANLGTDNAAAALAKSAKRRRLRAHRLRHRDDAQVGDAVLVHLRLPLLEQLLRRGDPAPQEHALRLHPRRPRRGGRGHRAAAARAQQRHGLRRSTGCSASPIRPPTGSRPARPRTRRSWASRPARGCSRRS